jgi:hypothetical protein
MSYKAISSRNRKVQKIYTTKQPQKGWRPTNQLRATLPLKVAAGIFDANLLLLLISLSSSLLLSLVLGVLARQPVKIQREPIFNNLELILSELYE